MSSQGNNSVRVYSRATFATLAGDPLSREVSTPSVSSAEFAPDVASCPVDKGIAGPVRDPASTSGRINEEEKDDEVAVNYEDFQSMLFVEDLIRIAARYNLEVLMPYELEWLHHPTDGYVTLSETYLKFGVRFPLHPFFVDVLKYLGLTVFQVTPTGWAHMIGLFSLFIERRLGLPTVVEFA